MVLRFLAGADHDDEAHKLQTFRIIMVTFVFLAGACIFLPYIKCMRKNEE